ncbi:MAG: hypothetical protein BJ554DRAFT_4147 [Olpidium bornovanus]|uniref:NAD-dependent glutamate dehydrogenase N-terminal domain-containing protein n=1 Tax=Olpidium bornovanus TaxID=278681 RepID=A0A8H7ZMI7_9FUNG|nr:MAG: hypothetical protein BJ554DRAFT_4147 [Olpidium bornovanus]
MSVTSHNTLVVPGHAPQYKRHDPLHSGYSPNVFPAKQQQMADVCANIEEKGFIPKELIVNEVTWFYR